MSDKFPVQPQAFSGGSRLTSAQQSEGPDSAPLYALLNSAGQSAEATAALAASVDLSAATAAVVASANHELATNVGAARSFTLPDFATAPDGWEHTFISFDGLAFAFTIARAVGDTINGVAGDVALIANHQFCKVMKIAGASGWTAFGGTMPTPA